MTYINCHSHQKLISNSGRHVSSVFWASDFSCLVRRTNSGRPCSVSRRPVGLVDVNKKLNNSCSVREGFTYTDLQAELCCLMFFGSKTAQIGSCSTVPVLPVFRASGCRGWSHAARAQRHAVSGALQKVDRLREGAPGRCCGWISG